MSLQSEIPAGGEVHFVKSYFSSSTGTVSSGPLEPVSMTTLSAGPALLASTAISSRRLLISSPGYWALTKTSLITSTSLLAFA